MSEQEAGARHRPGRGSQVTEAERNQIIEAYVLERPTVAALAKRFGRRRETIAGIVHSPACEAAKAVLADASVEKAREVLRLASTMAAQSWVTSIPKAAERGNHQAARDLLLHTKAIEPVSAGAGSGVTVIVGMPGLPGLPGWKPGTLEMRAQPGHSLTEKADE